MMDEKAISKRVTDLYNEILTFKSSQGVGSASNYVYELSVSDEWDYDGILHYYGQDVENLHNYTGAFELTPHFYNGIENAPTEYYIDGYIGALPLSTIEPSGAVDLDAWYPGPDIQRNYQDDIPAVRQIFPGRCGVPVRYIKVGINGNSVNNYNHWVEVMALTSKLDEYYSGEPWLTPGGMEWQYEYRNNVARGKTVTGQNVSSTTNIQRVTDGDTASANYFGGGANGYSTITIDLGEIRYISDIYVWLYYADNRYYKQLTISTGVNNVAGTADLADIWVNKTNSDIDGGGSGANYEYYSSNNFGYNRGYGHLMMYPEVKLKARARSLAPGWLETSVFRNTSWTT